MKRVFSLNCKKTRLLNLSLILPNILKQADVLHLNFIELNDIPNKIFNEIKDEKIKINCFYKGGSELRFFNYNDYVDAYYFTIDDDILYPINYSDVLIKNMEQHKNNVVCCVHASNVNLKQEKDFYKKNKKVYHFKEKLDENKNIMIPGVGTSCFNTSTTRINVWEFNTPNMSDVYVGCFSFNQNIPIISISRDDYWLKPIKTNDSTIFGNNPYMEIDELINKTFKND